MATYRPIHVKIWHDPRFQSLPSDSKLVFIYLFTNPNITETGVYPCTMKTISDETTIPLSRVADIVKHDLSEMVHYDEKNFVIWVKNFLKYNGRGRPQYVYRSLLKDMDNTLTSLWEDFKKYYETLLQDLSNTS